MTDTERGLQTALDATPDDWGLRLILADHLAEIGDEREAGYRALAALRLNPCNAITVIGKFFKWAPHDTTEWTRTEWPKKRAAAVSVWVTEWNIGRHIPHLWFDAIYPRMWYFRNRLDAEDKAAVAFAKLSARDQAKIMALPPAVSSRTF